MDGFHMTESASGRFTIHYTQDKRENDVGRGCIHTGGTDNEYVDEFDHCYTAARKVCSVNLADLIAWAAEHNFETKPCTHCNTKEFPFPAIIARDGLVSGEGEAPGRLLEGAARRATVIDYARDPIARRRCIDHYGPTCVACGFDFGAVYGPLAAGFIHVHHLDPLAENGEEHEVDPIADLRPVCPNCHAVIHLRGECRGVEEVKRLLRNAKGRI